MKKELKNIFLFTLITCLLINGNLFYKDTSILAKEPHHIDIAIAHGGSAAGNWLLLAEGIAGILREELPDISITVVPGGSDTNIALLQRREIDLGLSATDSANNAINGRGSFSEPVSLDSVNSIACFYYSKIHFVVLNNVNISSIEEIKEKKIPLNISVGRRGSGMEIGANRIFSEYGITYEDIEKWGGKVLYFGMNDSIRMLADGQLNAYIALGVVPLTELVELSMKRSFKMLPIKDEIIEKMANDFNYIKSIIPLGSYDDFMEDMLTIGPASGLFASADLDEETVYLITKALIKNINRLRQIHNQLKDITPEFMSQEMVFPVHPGAKRAYNE